MTTLTTERLVLRPFSETDAPLVERYASDPDVAKTALNIPHPYPEGGALTFIQSAQQQVEEGSALFFAMTEKGVGDCIGIISVSLATAHNRGELGYWIAKPYWRKGYGTEAARAVMAHCFNECGLNKCMAVAFLHNPASWRIMEKIGMKEEGILRQGIKKNGVYMDAKYYGLLRDEFQEMTSSLL